METLNKRKETRIVAFNGSGTFNLTTGNPVATGTVIEASWANDTLGDIAVNGLSLCLTTDGQSAMAAPLKLPNGSVSAPALTFSASSTTGLWRPGSNLLALSVSGVEVMRWSSTGVAVTGTLGVTGASTLAALSATTGTFSGAITASNATSTVTASNIVRWDGSGNLFANYFSSPDASISSGVTGVLAKTSGSDLHRTATPAAIATFLSGQTMNIAGNATTTSQTTIGRMVGAGPSYGSYGSISVTGATGGYSGIAFDANNAVFMVSGTTTGVYRNNSTWDWYWVNGVLTAGTVPAANISGTVASATTSASCSGNAATATTAGYITNSAYNGYGTRTVSASAPSGGSNGDIWYQT